MKKFYTMVSANKVDEGYAIQLDGKTVQTPLKQDLVAPTQALADAIVQEWSAQDEDVKPDTMPLSQILITAIDKIRDRDAITDNMMKYLDTDLVCYWAKKPPELAAKQKEVWGRWVKWFDEHFEVPLYTTKKIEAMKQEEEAHKRVWNYIEALDDYYFTLLHILTSLTGSIVVSLAFCEEEITPEEVFNVVKLEELFKSEIYNEDVHGAAPNEEKDRENLQKELAAASQFLELVNAE
ncbi:MAG: ATP12 chaperone family protein [Alphaproteobacteria bacterium]|nr:ATP12 chaperone family protein [Alphaproteobacteria bacterium]